MAMRDDDVKIVFVKHSNVIYNIVGVWESKGGIEEKIEWQFHDLN